LGGKVAWVDAPGCGSDRAHEQPNFYMHRAGLRSGATVPRLAEWCGGRLVCVAVHEFLPVSDARLGRTIEKLVF
jgi:hypothetical protein